MRLIGLILAALFTVCTVSLTASAGQVSSVYTKLELKKCKTVANDPTGTGWIEFRCKGHNGIDVWLAEGDLRFYVAFGPNAKNQVARGQTIPPFNNVHHTLEWRVEKKQGKWVPFATILRYFWGADGRKGQTLVVTKLDGDEACHVAHIRADGNANANVEARRAADTLSRGFDCRTSQVKSYFR